ncbi:flagellar filament capping protein FliD [Paenarthrobacter sp. Z7-10]|uniref:flagellar filament capping protein FliD n=1 Tax=Paenarthrobacter sp. Z7-10 TaxID=2787635 RepID=UPI0022A98D99|nr:flagellar filament capping protein FliD [Paenarthrobacter sp. Z7-10]MCZ2403326.1 flagellar filament capping protein FliD [Paenarthrobacter sp. Z7-10]
MAGISLDGLSSGLDTTALISQLMQVEAIPQTLLKNQATSVQTTVSALQGLNSQISDLATLAKGNAAPGALNLYKTSASSNNVTATATSTANAGSIDVVVKQLAQAQVSVSDAMADPSGLTALTVVVGGVSTEITPKSSSLDDVISAFNAAGTVVSATKVSVGSGSYRLQFAATASGVAGGFQIFQGTAAEVAAKTATALPTTAIRPAQDAQVTLWAGSAAEQVVTSSSNTFSDLLPGVSMTVNAVSDPLKPATTVSVARDDNQISAVASGLVSALNNIFAVISNRSAVTTSTSSTGVATVSGGVFTGDSSISGVNQSLLSAASMPVNGHSPSEYGISITKTGNMAFDAAKFAAAMASDPTGTQATLQTLAQRISDAAAAASDPYTGTITTKITGQKSSVDDLNKQIADWDDRLATRQSILKKTYSDMELALSSIKSQGTWLTSQLAALPTMNQSNNNSSSS